MTNIVQDIVNTATEMTFSADMLERMVADPTQWELDWDQLAVRSGYDTEWVDAEVRANVLAVFKGEEVAICEDCGHNLPDGADHEVHTNDGDIYEVFACKNAECGGTTRVLVAWIPD